MRVCSFDKVNAKPESAADRRSVDTRALARRRLHERLERRRAHRSACVCSRGGLPIQGRALLRHASAGRDQLVHALRRHLLPVAGAGGARDALVHERAAQVVGARLPDKRARPLRPSFTHDTWMLGITGCSASRATACISIVSRIGRTLARAAFQVHRRFHVHERQRHEFGEAAGARLQRSGSAAGGAPSARSASTWPNMMVAVVLKPTRCAASMTCNHARWSSLSGQITRRTSSSRISAAVPGKCAQAGIAQTSAGTLRPAGPSVLRAVRRPPAARTRGRAFAAAADLTARQSVEVRLTGVVGMDAALHAHFGRAAFPRLVRAPYDFFERPDHRADRAGSR